MSRSLSEGEISSFLDSKGFRFVIFVGEAATEEWIKEGLYLISAMV